MSAAMGARVSVIARCVFSRSSRIHLRRARHPRREPHPSTRPIALHVRGSVRSKPIPPNPHLPCRSATLSALDSKPPSTQANRAAVMGGAFVVSAVRSKASGKRNNATRVKRDTLSQKSGVSVRASGTTDASGAGRTFFTGDIGGTNARLQVWTHVVGVGSTETTTLLFEKTYGTQGHPTFESVVADLFKDSGVDKTRVTAACFAVAGPVKDDRCAMTNIEWVVDGPSLAKEFAIGAVKVINDFAAVGYGVLDLSNTEMVTLNEGTAKVRPRTVPKSGTTVLPLTLVTVVHTSRYTRPAKGRLTSADCPE